MEYYGKRPLQDSCTHCTATKARCLWFGLLLWRHNIHTISRTFVPRFRHGRCSCSKFCPRFGHRKSLRWSVSSRDGRWRRGLTVGVPWFVFAWKSIRLEIAERHLLRNFFPIFFGKPAGTFFGIDFCYLVRSKPLVLIFIACFGLLKHVPLHY